MDGELGLTGADNQHQSSNESGCDDNGEDVDVQPDVDAAVLALKNKKEAKRAKKILKSKATESKKKSAKPKKGNLSKQTEEDKPKESLGLDEAAEFQVTISTKTVPPDTRTKHALDDFVVFLQFSRKNLPVKLSDADANKTKAFLISLFLELAWCANVGINGKSFKVYSAFREECYKVFMAAHRKIQVGQKAFDPLQLAQHLLLVADPPVLWQNHVTSGVVVVVSGGFNIADMVRS